MKWAAVLGRLLIGAWVIGFVACLRNTSCADIPKPNQLLDCLTEKSRYDKRSQPQLIEGPIQVNSSLFVSVMGGLDSQTEFKAQLVFNYKWQDPRLQFHQIAAQFDILEFESWAVDSIWVPAIYIGNDKDSTKPAVPKENVLVTISPQGVVSYFFRINLRMYCAMDVSKFPFDQQTCHMNLISWSLKSRDLILHWDKFDDKSPVKINSEFPMLEYSLLSVKTSSSIAERVTGNYSMITVTFTLQRESGHYLLDYYVPSIFLVMLSWVSFWFDPSAIPGRVTIGSSTLLTFITLSRNVSTSLPKVSYIKALDIYTIMCTAFIFCSLLEFAFVNNIWRRTKNIELTKLNTKNVLKKTLSPNITRRNSLNKIKRSSGISSWNSLTSMHVPENQNELTVTSYGGIGHLERRLSKQFSSTPGNLNRISLPVPDINKNDFNNDSTLSLSIVVPELNKIAASAEGSPTKVRQSMAPQDIAKWLDRRSRIAFPIFFIIANCFYWIFIWF